MIPIMIILVLPSIVSSTIDPNIITHGKERRGRGKQEEEDFGRLCRISDRLWQTLQDK